MFSEERIKIDAVRPMRVFQIILFVFCFARFCLADQEGFPRYQIIVDKHPFGEMPPVLVEDEEVPFNESFAKNIRLTMIYKNGDDVRVGLVDDSKNNKSYILRINGFADGFELIDASVENAEARLKKELFQLAQAIFTDKTVIILPKPKKEKIERE